MTVTVIPTNEIYMVNGSKTRLWTGRLDTGEWVRLFTALVITSDEGIDKLVEVGLLHVDPEAYEPEFAYLSEPKATERDRKRSDQ